LEQRHQKITASFIILYLEISYVVYYYKRLFLGKRKNFGSKELSKLNIQKIDVDALIKNFDFLNPSYSKDVYRKDKRFFKWAIKKSPLTGAIVQP